MTAKGLREYLAEFPDDSEVSFIVANPSEGVRERYPIRNVFGINPTDENSVPVLLIDVDKPESLDGEVEE